MDHFYIMDAYQSNRKLVPIGDDPAAGPRLSEEQLRENVTKAAYQTKDKYDALGRRESALTWALASVESMVAVMGFVILSSIVYSDLDMSQKILYALITSTAFVFIGILIYQALFEGRMFEATRHRMVYEEIYRFNDDNAAKAYRISQELRDLRERYRKENTAECIGDSKDPEVQKKTEEFRAAIDQTVKNASFCKPGALKDAIVNGMLHTITPEGASVVDDTIRALRSFLGSETYREVEEPDAYDIIDDVVVPKMVASRSRVFPGGHASSGGSGAGGTEPDVGKRLEQCDTWCDDNVEAIVRKVLDPSQSATAVELDAAWERCRPDMVAACESGRLRTGGQRCAFGCGDASRARRGEHSVLRLSNHAPSSGQWEEQTDLQVSLEEPGSTDGLERLCFDAALANDNVDAAYCGQDSAGSSLKCYFHHKAGSSGRGTFSASTGESFTGKLLFKPEHNVELPGASAAEVAAEIAAAVKAVRGGFDITPYDVHLYDTLRFEDGRFADNRRFYEDVFDLLKEQLKPTEDSDFTVPSIPRINQVLETTSGRKFRTDYVWPVAKSSIYMHLRALRMDQKESFAPRSGEEQIRRTQGFTTANAGAAAAACVLGYLFFVLERQAEGSADGTVTLKSAVFDLWRTHVVAGSVASMLFAIVFSWIHRGNARAVFNERMKNENTRKFVDALYRLRAFLFSMTSTLPGLEGDDDTHLFMEPRRPLIEAAHTGNVDVIKPFASPDDMMIGLVSLDDKLELMRLAQDVVKMYDRCNKLGAETAIPFPLPEIIVYGTSLILVVVGMWYMYARFNFAEVARRVQRVRELRPKLYMGDASAANEISGLLECAENTVQVRIALMRTMFVALISVGAIVVTVMITNSDKDYNNMLNSGFMAQRGRCVK